MDILKTVGLAQKSWRENASPGLRVSEPLQQYPHMRSKVCPGCQNLYTLEQWSHSLEVCTHCHYHLPIGHSQRLALLTDCIYHEIGEEIRSQDRLIFEDTMPYADRLKIACEKTHRQEALESYFCQIQQHKVVLSLFDFSFIGGSMSSSVGQRFVQAAQYAIDHRVPLVCQAISGGARMQEGLYSLIQMTRTSAILAQLSYKKIPYIVTLCSPCMGGVSASLASLGDVILAEPNALIGFTGPRVIAQTVGKTLPKGFQTSEFLAKCGFIDQIVQRKHLKFTIARWISRLQYGVEP